MGCMVEIGNLLVFLNRYKGRDDSQLSSLLEFDTKAKNRLSLRMRRIAQNYKGKETFSFLCSQEHIQLKTIQLNKKRKVQEARSFPEFEYKDICCEDWETSSIKKRFSDTFIFCIFRECVYLGAFLWQRDKTDLDGEVKQVWDKVRELVMSGNAVKEKGDKIKLNFPAEAETRICHIRPHGRNATDTSVLPCPDQKTGLTSLPTQSFWLNHGYLNRIIEQNKKLLFRLRDKKESNENED